MSVVCKIFVRVFERSGNIETVVGGKYFCISLTAQGLPIKVFQ
ncbi:hypothetical protein CP10743SC13_0577 [Chlamydia psittaci 10_743_SC13]|nr:hypothetical protein CP10743SC13_0577 [Chlamydia psittaci 10_743_SC13]